MTELGKKIEAELLEDVKKKAKNVIFYVNPDGEKKEFFPLYDTAEDVIEFLIRHDCKVLAVESNSFYQGELINA